MKYLDLIIEASESGFERDAERNWLRHFKVRVLSSPAGDMAANQAVPVQHKLEDLKGQLQQLDERNLDRDGLLALGRLLGLLLLPPAQDGAVIGVREFFFRSFDLALQQKANLRVRLRLPPELAATPWEYIYLDRVGAADGMAGFIALDPRIAIVRHEELPVPAPVPRVSGDITVLAALASPPPNLSLDSLDLDQEEDDLRQALSHQSGIQLTVLKNVTLDEVQKALPKTRVFHFAGHGMFHPESGSAPGTVAGVGGLAFDDGVINAETLGAQLRGNHVQLVVLGGCETGRRAGAYVWGSIAPALVRYELPAVVANQYSILDDNAIVFSRQFYCALAAGLPIERAVSAGRIAVFSRDQSGRDWGVPVLYLRAGGGELFEGVSDEKVRAAARASAEADVNVRVKEVAAGGFLTGAELRKFVSGKLHVAVTVGGTVYGHVVGLKVDSFGGGSASVNTQADTIGPGGTLIGAQIDKLGGGLARAESDVHKFGPRPAKPRARRAPAGTAAPRGEGATEETRKESKRLETESNVDVGTVSGGEVIGTQNLQVGTINFGVISKLHEDAIEEKLRLDVALPKSAVVNEEFYVVVAVNQPDAPTLTVGDLDQIVSKEGKIIYGAAEEFVGYRIEITGAGFQVTPPSYLLKLRPKQNSEPVAFQVVSSRPGKRSLLVNAYQEDGVLAAQTRLNVEVTIAVSP